MMVVERLLHWYLKRLTPKKAVDFFLVVIDRYQRTHEPENALRFLLGLDSRLYFLQGQAAVAFGRGMHVKHRYLNYHRFFIDRIAEHEKVIDIGCGIGAVSYDIAEQVGCPVLGIDMEPSNIQSAVKERSRENIRYVIGKVPEDLPEERFDVVVMSNVLEHIEDRIDLLQRIVEVTSTGRFLFRVPLFERDWRVPAKKELGIEWRLDRTHQTEYSIESFQKEMQNGGLRIVSHEVRWGEIWAEARTNENACRTGGDGHNDICRKNRHI